MSQRIERREEDRGFAGKKGLWQRIKDVALMAFDESAHGGLVTVAEAPTARE